MSDAVQEALRKSYVAWNTGNVDLLDEVFAADVAYHFASFPDMDLAGLKEVVAATRMGQPDSSPAGGTARAWKSGTRGTRSAGSPSRGHPTHGVVGVRVGLTARGPPPV